MVAGIHLYEFINNLQKEGPENCLLNRERRFDVEYITYFKSTSN